MEFYASLGSGDLSDVILDLFLIALDALLVVLYLGSLFHSLPIRITDPAKGKLGREVKGLRDVLEGFLHFADASGSSLTPQLRDNCYLGPSGVALLVPSLSSQPIRV